MEAAMNKKKTISSFVMTMIGFLLMNFTANAGEPIRPQVHLVLPSEKEIRIREIENLPIEETFGRLKRVDFLVDEDLLHRAIFVAFRYRHIKAIEHALQSLRLPRVQIVDGKSVSRARDLYLAKKTLEVFPDKAVNKLLYLYETSGPVMRGNVIRVSGKLAGGEAIKNLFIEALDDKAFCETKHPEITGKPLRICDVAYNQLVLRYRIKKVLRTLGPLHAIEVRNYHIDVLKDRVKSW
jgi:hypothetical protein